MSNRIATLANRIRYARRATRGTTGLPTRAAREQDMRRIDFWRGVARAEREDLMRALDAAGEH